MIEFLSLFMGLVSGVQHVELKVEERVVAVELMMDGRQIEVLRSAPWRADLDLGDGLVPHELVAVARDGAGGELERIRQWINVFGPGAGEGESRTAVVILLEDRGPFGIEQLPKLAAMRSWFVDPRGRPLTVVAVEQGPAEVVVVRDPAVQADLEVLEKIYLQDILAETPAAREAVSRSSFRLGSGTGLRLVSTRAAPKAHASGSRNLFGYSPSLPMGAGILPFVLDQGDSGLVPRDADAVAVAAAGVHGTGRRRAVVLLTPARRDHSLYTPAAIREYLARLQVPLLAVTFESTGADARWAGLHIEDPPTNRRGAVDATKWNGPRAFRSAMAQLRSHLERQRVVWIAGRHRPQDVRLSATARSVRLAGDLPIASAVPTDDAGPAATDHSGGES